MKQWPGCRRPHAFKAVYTVTLHGEKLRTDLRVMNTGDAPFEFTGALHSYFEVLDVDVAKVKGLAGLTYLDKVGAATSCPPSPPTLSHPCASTCVTDAVIAPTVCICNLGINTSTNAPVC